MKETVKNSLNEWLAKLQPEEVDVLLREQNEEYEKILKSKDMEYDEIYFEWCSVQ